MYVVFKNSEQMQEIIFIQLLKYYLINYYDKQYLKQYVQFFIYKRKHGNDRLEKNLRAKQIKHRTFTKKQ